MTTKTTITVGTIIEATGEGKRIQGTLGKVIADLNADCWAIDWNYSKAEAPAITTELKKDVKLYKMA